MSIESISQRKTIDHHTSYTEAFREFRIHLSENDFHDDYPLTAEMTLAITSGLRYHYLYNYRSLTIDQTTQLMDAFIKRFNKLSDYRSYFNEELYSPERLITHVHNSPDLDLAHNNWIIICYMYGLIDRTNERIAAIREIFAYENAFSMRNPIQLKLLQKDIDKRISIQNRLIELNKLVNNIDEFNHIYKFSNIPSVNIKTGERSYKIIIDSYYDGLINERLGTETIYEWILTDNINRFQEWYNDGGLNIYRGGYSGKNKTTNYRMHLAAHILASDSVNIIRFIIMNHIPEFLDSIDGMHPLMDPWRYPVNDPECFKLLRDYYRKDHENIVRDCITDEDTFNSIHNVYRFVKPEIAEAIYNEFIEIANQVTGTDNLCLQLYEAVKLAKFGHIGPIESLDWDALISFFSDKDNYTDKDKPFIRPWLDLFRYHIGLLKSCEWYQPFGMNPSTSVYIRDLFIENGLTTIKLRPKLRDCLMISHLSRYIDYHQISMPDDTIDESDGTDDELYI